MAERQIQGACRSCGVDTSGSAAARCEGCFEAYLREIDIVFLESYAAFGCASRRVVAEACLRQLVMESPGHRKVLAAHVIEQFVLAVTDMLALYEAVRRRESAPVVRSFLDFRIDSDAARSAFADFAGKADRDLLAGLGLPHPTDLAEQLPAIPPSDRAILTDMMTTVLGGFRRLGERGAAAVLALQSPDGSVLGGRALIPDGTWESVALDPDEVASIAVDAANRRLRVQPVPVDESTLAEVVDTIGACTAASRDLIHAVLTLRGEGAPLVSAQRSRVP